MFRDRNLGAEVAVFERFRDALANLFALRRWRRRGAGMHVHDEVAGDGHAKVIPAGLVGIQDHADPGGQRDSCIGPFAVDLGARREGEVDRQVARKDLPVGGIEQDETRLAAGIEERDAIGLALDAEACGQADSLEQARSVDGVVGERAPVVGDPEGDVVEFARLDILATRLRAFLWPGRRAGRCGPVG